jgi:hypothetical protein
LSCARSSSRYCLRSAFKLPLPRSTSVACSKQARRSRGGATKVCQQLMWALCPWAAQHSISKNQTARSLQTSFTPLHPNKRWQRNYCSPLSVQAAAATQHLRGLQMGWIKSGSKQQHDHVRGQCQHALHSQPCSTSVGCTWMHEQGQQQHNVSHCQPLHNLPAAVLRQLSPLHCTATCCSLPFDSTIQHWRSKP